MADRPINLRDWQVRAALDGRLSVLVVPIKPPKKWAAQFPHFRPDVLDGMLWFWDGEHERVGASAPLPLIVGARLSVREAHCHCYECGYLNFRADGQRHCAACDANVPRWFPSPQMMRRESRLTLIPASIRVCRVQEVTEDEARACGAAPSVGGWWTASEGRAGTTPRAAFALAWGAQHGPDSWERNPWVCIATVSVHHRNIDSMEG